jgi:ABC-type amino acid transport substrate-binding protein
MMSSTMQLRAAVVAIPAICAAGAALAQGATTGTLDRIRQSSTIRIAYRDDAPPFSYKNSAGDPAGFMVDLCQAVSTQLTSQLGVPSLRVTFVPVTASDRFEVIQQQRADLLCEPTSATLSRRELVDFSITTFIDGASLMIRPDGPHNLQELAGRKIGVLAGTTTEQELRNSLSGAGLSADVIPAKTHAEGLAMLDAGEISAYFADRSILVTLLHNSKAPANLQVADVYLTVEPYALALSHGDDQFRLAVDRALSHIYRSGQMRPIFEHTFGDNVSPGPTLQTLYLISGLPD